MVASLLVALLLGAADGGGQPAPPDAFARLRAAYAARDPVAAAAAYAPDAEVRYEYRGAPHELHRGRAAITASFTKFFAQFDSSQAIDLNFRVARRAGANASGFYRLRVGRSVFHGRFDVSLDAAGRFARDVSRDASVADFERAPGAVLFAADDEVLDAAFYDRLLGRFRTTDGCDVIVTRSIVRLFVRDACTGQWRGLTRVRGEEWFASSHVLGGDTAARYTFVRRDGGGYDQLRRTTARGAQVARRTVSYRMKPVEFTAPDGTRLSGTLYQPVGGGRRAAAVLIHGSGGQDRHGYASIIGVLADALANDGRAALVFDKRGVGSSQGDWSRAGFTVLADDVRAAMAFLATRDDIDPGRIGLAGSSQAGWIAAAAIARGARPADVFLLGAAGAAFTVAEQNLYNTRMRMACAQIPTPAIGLALTQQSAFFAFLRDSTRGAALDSVTRDAQRNPLLREWLFPDTRGLDRRAGEWYLTLDPGFDPTPVWRAYRGDMWFVFSALDDATDAAGAAARLSGTAARVFMLPAAQHLGLQARDACHAELRDVSRFAPALFDHLSKFARRQR